MTTTSAPTDSDAFKPVSRRVATLWNVVFAYTYLGLVLVRNLLMVPLYLRTISMAEYGAWLATGAILSYLMMDFGLLAVLIQQVAVAYGNADRARLQRLVGTGLVISLVLSALMSVVGVLISAPIAGFFPTLTSLETASLTHALQISALANGTYLLAMALIGLLRSLQRPFVSGLLRVMAEAVGLAVTAWLLVEKKWGLQALPWGLMARTVLAIGGNGCWFLWLWSRELRLRLEWAWSDNLSLWRLSSYQFLTYLAGGLKWGSDPFLVGVMLGPKANVLYVMTIRSYEMVRMLIEQLATAMQPSMAHLYGEGKLDYYKRIAVSVFRAQSLLAAIGMGGVIAFNRGFVGLWIGPENYAGPAVTDLAAIFGFLAILAGLPYLVLQSIGLFWQMSKVVWLDLIIRVPVVVLLLHVFQAPWAGMAGALIGQALAFGAYLLYLAGRELSISGAEALTLLRQTLRAAIPSLLLGAAVSVTLPTAHSWPVLMAEGTAYVAVAGLVAAYLNPEVAGFIRRRGRAKIVSAVPMDGLDSGLTLELAGRHGAS